MKPKVSVIIPTYNRCQLLAERSLPSILKQTYQNFECIVVDDGSSDETPQVMEKFIPYDSRVKYIRLPENRGGSTALNCGVKNSTGDYICRLDDDDEYLPTFLEEAIQKFNKLPEDFGGVACGSIIDYGKGPKAYAPPRLSSFYTAISEGWLLKREVFFKKNIFFDEELSSDADADFGIRFFQVYKADVIDKPLVIRYADKGRAHMSYPSEKRLRELKRFLEKDLKFYEMAGRSELAYIYLFAGRDFCWGGDIKQGLPLLCRSLLTKPSLRTFLNFATACGGPFIYKIYWNLESAAARFIRTHFTNRIPPEKNT